MKIRLYENVNLSDMRIYLNKNFSKRNGAEITISDVQGYIERRRLPGYMGNYSIERNKEIKSVKLYNLIKNG